MNTLENRPAVYLAGLSDEELLQFAEMYAVTALEVQLHQRLKAELEKNEASDRK